jgi:hypothetical protein
MTETLPRNRITDAASLWWMTQFQSSEKQEFEKFPERALGLVLSEAK